MYGFGNVYDINMSNCMLLHLFYSTLYNMYKRACAIKLGWLEKSTNSYLMDRKLTLPFGNIYLCLMLHLKFAVYSF